MTITAQEMRDFTTYLRNCTDAQVQGVYNKEAGAGRMEYAELALMDADRRGVTIDTMIADHLAADEEDDRCTHRGGHEFVCTGTAYGGDDTSYHGEGRSYCIYCGADGDA